jgi:hypothetical protein
MTNNKTKADAGEPGRKMATAKTKSKPRRASRAHKKPADLGSLRQKISRVVAGDALEMVNDVIAEVHKGQHTPMKYLFELIGLFPASAEDEGPLDDSLVQTLLRRLGFPGSATEGEGNGAPAAASGAIHADDTSEPAMVPGVPVE